MGDPCLIGTKSSDVTDTPDVMLRPKSISLPVNPKSRAEHKVFFDLAGERFERTKSAIYDELSKEVQISWGFQYELMRHAERPLSQRR